MIKQTILFDLDDTLIHCNKYFDLVIEQFADLMQTWFHTYHIPVEEIKKKQAQIDLERVILGGFDPNHFPQSFVDTYNYYSDSTLRPMLADEIERLIEIGRTVYGHIVEPYPFMVETLQELAAQGHELHLYTGGEQSIQMRKVTEADLVRFFGDRIHVTRHKTADYLEQLIRDCRFDRNSTWMIGNSLRTDVIPALKTGLHTIYMPALQEWSYNIVDIDAEPKGAFFTLSSLHEIPETIRSYSTLAASGE